MMACFAANLRAQETGAPAQREWRDEIVYVVIVQKFCNGDAANDVMPRRYGKDKARYEGGFWGGDLAGVIQKLDYIESLGVTAILLYPIMANDTEPFGKYLATGYRPKDYFKVDESFGDLQTLKDLAARAHERHLRVILDLPLGMAGAEHPYRRDLSKTAWFGKATPYGVTQWNAENPEVAAYLTRISKFWRDETGCDGFRLDSAHLHSSRFWVAPGNEASGPCAKTINKPPRLATRYPANEETTEELAEENARMRHRVLLLVAVWLATCGCSTCSTKKDARTDNSALIPKVLPDREVKMEGMSPDWVKTLIMAQFRIETATPEGTFASATKVLDHYAEMGVNGLWINPIWERGSKGNGYGNYGPNTIEPLLTGADNIEGSREAVRQFVDEAHKRNIRVFFDIVVWGTSKDSPLVTRHPEFYRKRSGELVPAWGGWAFDWQSAGLQDWYKQAAVGAPPNIMVIAGDDLGLQLSC